LCSDVSDLPAPNDSLPLVDSGFYDFDNLTLHLMQWVDNEAYRYRIRQLADLALISAIQWLSTLPYMTSHAGCCCSPAHPAFPV
ncbi:hypothetical protein, partial [Klebsiella pneumoniae]|uniref:hypothetical protein n=1 Tax=Klebsiella pneumoniae TaxID=573 RepID=UPI0022EAEAC7